MATVKKRAESFLHGLPFFEGLPEADVERLLAAAETKDYPKHKILLVQDDPANRFFIILSGWIKIFRTSEQGEEAVIALLTRGDVFGEAAIFDGSIYPFSAEVAENAHLLEIPAGALKRITMKSPALTQRIMAILSDDVKRLQLENEHVSLMTASQRAGCLLLRLSSDMKGNGGTFSFPYDKSMAAALLGMKPETFSRALGELKSAGVTVKGPEVRIESFERLAQHCCRHCTAGVKDCKGANHKIREEKFPTKKVKEENP